MAQPKVLVVDDEAGIQRIYVRGLGGKGVTLLAALDTAQAARLLETEKDIAVVVLDGQIPGTQSTVQLAVLAKQRNPDCLTIGSSSKPDLQSRLAGVCDFVCPKDYGPWLVRALLVKLGYPINP